MQITEKQINEQWKEYTLTNDQGMEIHFLNYGAIITKLLVPDQSGILENVVLGYKNYEEYKQNDNFMGAIIGRVAGRIDNAEVTIEGTTYPLENNEGENHLHSGSTGLHQVLWSVETFQKNHEVRAKLHYKSPAGESGYPGNVLITVTYRITNDNQFIIDYHAQTDQTTVLTLTNHTYFNLSGKLRNTVDQHRIQMHADQFSELDKELIPTGNLLRVDHTPFDFRTGNLIEQGIKSHHMQNELVGNGYDHYFLFSQTSGPEVTITDPDSGRMLTVETTHPGMVMYTANGLDNILHLRERQSQRYLGVCLETQEHPASLHHDQFPSIILEKDQPYERQTVFSFSTTK